MQPSKAKQIRKRRSAEEQTQYINYLIKFEENFSSFELRKRTKVFIQLANIIKTRSSHQIKSHHQKLLKKYGSIQKIITSLPLEGQSIDYRLNFDRFQQQSLVKCHKTYLISEEKSMSFQLMLNSKLHQLNLQQILKNSQNMNSRLNEDLLLPNSLDYQFIEIQEEYDFNNF